jgi:DNA polymerase elongation subunit (family B)
MPGGSTDFFSITGQGASVPKAKILFIDIENTPSLGYVWGKWDQNVIDFTADWHLLSFSWQWAATKTVHVLGLVDFPAHYRANPENDYHLVEKLWHLLDEADIVIGHNVDRFDIRKINTRFLAHGMPPPSPYRTVDTLKIAKKYFRFDSNKLDDLGRCLGVGR